MLRDAASLLKSGIGDVPKRIDGLMGQIKELSRENESLKGKLSSIEAGSLADSVQTIAGVPVLTAQVSAPDMDL